MKQLTNAVIADETSQTLTHSPWATA